MWLMDISRRQKIPCSRPGDKPVEDFAMTDKRPAIIMEEVTDPEELAKAQARWARCDRNAAWLQAHAAEIYARHRGQYICIAGEELFVADTPEAAWALAIAAHPEDDGRFMRYIPREKLARIYANSR